MTTCHVCGGRIHLSQPCAVEGKQFRHWAKRDCERKSYLQELRDELTVLTGRTTWPPSREVKALTGIVRKLVTYLATKERIQ